MQVDEAKKRWPQMAKPVVAMAWWNASMEAEIESEEAGVVISPDPPALVAPPFPPPPPPNAWAAGFEGGITAAALLAVPDSRFADGSLSERGEQLAAAAVREGLSAAESLAVRDSHTDQLMDRELMEGMDD